MSGERFLRPVSSTYRAKKDQYEDRTGSLMITRILVLNHSKYLLRSHKTTESITSAIEHGH
jgi:hypothetical protein